MLILFMIVGLSYAAPPVVTTASKTRIVSLDPFQIVNLDAYEVSGFALEPLARIEIGTRRLIPWLALSWNPNLKNKTLRVELRRNVRFHDGSDMSADDVVFTYHAYFDPRSHGELWRARFEAIASIRKINAHAVEFKFRDLNYSALENALTGLRVLPRSSYNLDHADHFRTSLSGSGPFRLSRFADVIEFAPFVDWWGQPKPDFALRIKFVADATLAAQMVAKGDLDAYVAAAELAPSPFRRQIEAGAGEGIWLDLNLRREMFRDFRVREALATLWNRSALAQKLFELAHVAIDAFSPRLPNYPAGAIDPYRPARARELLREAGYTRDKQISFSILSNGATADRWLTLYQADAAAVGVRVTLEHLGESAEYFARLKEGRYDVVVGEGALSDSVSSSTWSSHGAYNFSGFNESNVDLNLSRLEKEFGVRKREILRNDLIRQIRASGAQIPGVYIPAQSFLSSRRLNVDGTLPNEPWRWSLARPTRGG